MEIKIKSRFNFVCVCFSELNLRYNFISVFTNLKKHRLELYGTNVQLYLVYLSIREPRILDNFFVKGPSRGTSVFRQYLTVQNII